MLGRVAKGKKIKQLKFEKKSTSNSFKASEEYIEARALDFTEGFWNGDE